MSGLTIKELFTTWGFKVDDKALDAADAKLKKLEDTVKYVGGVAIGAAASIFGLATAAGNAGAEVAHAADRIGISAEALQEYQYAARLAGQSNEGFQGSLQTLVKNLFDARRGLGSSREAFYLLGNALGKDLMQKGLSAEEVLNNVADGLSLVTDKSRKLELAGQLFGGDAGAMLTTLRSGSAGLAELRKEARATGVVMSESSVRAAEAYKASLERMKSTLLGVRNAIGVGLFPVVERVMGSFTRWIAVNRRWLTSGIHVGVETLTTFIGRVVYIVERAASVANTAAIAFGGWQRVLKIVTAMMVAMLLLRLSSFFGTLIMVAIRAAAAMTILGNAGLLAQLKLAAIPIAIGAAFIALLLIIEDVVAYFQGRKSITGLILKDFEGLDKGLDRFIEPILAKVSAFGKRIGRSIVDGIEKLNEADWQKVGEFVLHSLELLLKISTIPAQIGMAIAGGIMDGLVDGLRKKFPKLAEFLGLNEGGAGVKTGAVAPMDETGTKIFGKSFTDVAKSVIDFAKKPVHVSVDSEGVHVHAGEEAPAEASPITSKPVGPSVRSAPGGAAPTLQDVASAAANIAANLNSASAVAVAPPAPAGSTTSSSNLTQHIKIDAPQTINVPAGTPAKEITPMATESLKDKLAPVIRETQRATAPAVDY